jgi:hypothetical protein
MVASCPISGIATGPVVRRLGSLFIDTTLTRGFSPDVIGCTCTTT